MLFALLLWVVACNEQVIEKPKNLIPQKTMEAILYDIAILHAGRSTSEHILVANGLEPMGYIYAKYDIDSLQLVESDAYYAAQPTVYENIYITINEALEREHDVLEAERAANANKPAEELEPESPKDTLF